MMTRGLLIITADHLASARALASTPPFSLTEVEAAALFVPAGSASGDAPASHWWACGEFSAEQWQAIHSLAAALPWAECHAYDMARRPTFPFEQLAALGLQPMKGNLP